MVQSWHAYTTSFGDTGPGDPCRARTARRARDMGHVTCACEAHSTR